MARDKLESIDALLSIIDFIEEKRLSPGDKLPSIGGFAAMWGISYSQVRTGLIVADALGVVEVHPRAGSFVKTPDDKRDRYIEKIFSLLFRVTVKREKSSMLDLWEIKSMIDSEIFYVAAGNRNETELVRLQEVLVKQESSIHDTRPFVEADETFHLRVAEIARNPLLTQMLHVVQVMLRSERLANVEVNVKKRKAIVDEHYQLFDAIRRKDQENIREIAYAHSNRPKWELLDRVVESRTH